MDLVFDQGTVLFGDCVERLKELPDNCIDSIVTDPPYGLGFMGKDWDAPWKDERTDKHGGDPAAVGKQFQQWCEQWAVECLRVLKPGGHILAFGGTRTYHRMVCAIEDAGFEIRDSIHWTYGCLTSDAEVLTDTGWKPGIEVGIGERVAQWDSDTGQIEMTTVQETFRAPWDGPMRVLRNADTDQVLTPDHRVYHRSWDRTMRDGVRTGEWSDWKVSEASEVHGQRVMLPVAGEQSGPGIGGEDYAALLGWVWTEGGFDLSGTGVRIYQSSVNAECVEDIAALMDRLGVHKRYDRDRTYTRRNGQEHLYTETLWFFSGDLANKVRADLPGKRPTYDLLYRMTVLEKKALIRSAMLGDGSGWGTKAQQFYQQYEDDLVWFQTALALSGMSGKVAMRPDRSAGQVYLRNRDTTELQSRHLKDREQHYTGEVWCLRVPSGAFMVRRNGKVFITGNSGFPKSMNVSKAIDKTATAAEPSQQWDGWGTALKPSHEPIVLARKPLEGTVAKNVLKYGTGALNIDANRIGTSDDYAPAPGGRRVTDNQVFGKGVGNPQHPSGRWPTNTILTHHVDCQQEGTREVTTGTAYPTRSGQAKPSSVYGVYQKQDRGFVTYGEGGKEQIPAWQCVEGCPVAAMDKQSGHLHGSGNKSDVGGGVSRFFQQVKWEPDYDAPLIYQAKASKKERNLGVENLPAVFSPTMGDGGIGGKEHDPDTATPKHNHHPTVKPVALMRYLVRLVTSSDGIVLDPFLGSGTTAVAAIQEGFSFVGCEFTEGYLDIIQARIRHALGVDSHSVPGVVSNEITSVEADPVDLSSFQEMFPGLT